MTAHLEKNANDKNWPELKKMIQKKWEKITDEDVEILKTDFSQLVEVIQKAYGFARDQAERQYDEFKKSVTNFIAPDGKSKRPASRTT